MCEKVMIDGCDVSGCCCYEDKRCLWTKKYYETCKITPFCEAVKNCYYKQLKRLQVENEELKKEINLYKNSIVANHDRAIGKRFEEVLEENEKFKKELHSLNCDGKCSEEKQMYKQALEEIRGITENYFEECGVPDDYFKRNNYSWKQHQIKGLTCKLQQILDKINEVLK